MENTLIYGGWKGRLDAGLPRGQVEAIVMAASDMTSKEIARKLGLSPVSVGKRLERAKFTLGMQRSVRGLCLEAMKRGIISPLVMALCAMLVTQTSQPVNPVRRPPVERRMAQFRVMRKINENYVIS